MSTTYKYNKRKIKTNFRLNMFLFLFFTWGLMIGFWLTFIVLMVLKQDVNPTLTYLSYIAAGLGLVAQIWIVVISWDDPRPLMKKTELSKKGKLNRSDISKLGVVYWMVAIMIPISLQSFIYKWQFGGLSNTLTTGILWGITGFFAFLIPTFLSINYKSKLKERGEIIPKLNKANREVGLPEIWPRDYTLNITDQLDEKARAALLLQQQKERESEVDITIAESEQNIGYNRTVSESKIFEQERERRRIGLETRKQNKEQDLLESKVKRDIRGIEQNIREFNQEDRSKSTLPFFRKPNNTKMSKEPEGASAEIENKVNNKTKEIEFDESEYDKFEEIKKTKTTVKKEPKKTRK